ncbi:MAG: flagellar filament outer layer protein FlaA [Spirochaetota bacterium]|nr:flagellar filament outer layer protein FlaA [Spirochaetota bacterium]
MKKNFLVILAVLFIAYPANSQEKKAESQEDKTSKKEVTIGDQVYYEITLEDFEKTEYTEKNIIYFSRSEEEKAGISMRTDYPAPIKNSKKYLGIKLYGKQGNAIQIIPAKKITIDKYCRSISMWIFGKNFAGELSMIIKDANMKAHRLIIRKLNFIGWRKLIIKLPDKIAQEDARLTKKMNIEIIKFIYKPGTPTRLPIWHYFYIDDIGAMVRKKYTDKQSDDW